jgi:ProP effector
LLKRLVESFAVFRDRRPLALGIHKAIQARIPEVEANHLRTAMRQHTSSTAYLKALVASDVRVDLDGVPAGEVTAEQKALAAQSLRERFRKSADQRKQKQQADELQEKLRLQAEERQQKLNQLADKFKRR